MGSTCKLSWKRRERHWLFTAQHHRTLKLPMRSWPSWRPRWWPIPPPSQLLLAPNTMLFLGYWTSTLLTSSFPNNNILVLLILCCSKEVDNQAHRAVTSINPAALPPAPQNDPLEDQLLLDLLRWLLAASQLTEHVKGMAFDLAEQPRLDQWFGLGRSEECSGEAELLAPF